MAASTEGLRAGEYGVDGSVAGLSALGATGLGLALLGAIHRLRGHAVLAGLELLEALAPLATLAVYLHTTRRGKFAVWAELLDGLQLRGDEHVLDVGCGRGAVLAMLAKRLPAGRLVGLDLWTADQSGNRPEATRRNLALEGVQRRCELLTADMVQMPFADGAFDLVVSSVAIHNLDTARWREHTRRLRALDEVVRVLKPGGRLVIADLFWTSVYARHLREHGLQQVRQRDLGWRFSYGPGVGTGLVTATKP